MENKKKIFILVLPSFGHINPICGLAKELAVKQKYELIFYGNLEHKDVIDRTGSTFRQYKNLQIADSKIKPINLGKNDAFEAFFTKMINFSHKSVPALLQDLERDKPDLVIYDNISLPAKYALRIMETRFRKGLSIIAPPPAVNFYTTFAHMKGVYPTDEQMKDFSGRGLKFMVSMAKIMYKQSIFSWNFGISVFNPCDFVFYEPEKLNIVSVFPELHPFVERFDSSYKFVGSCISENVRKAESFEPKLKAILDLFEPLNPNFSLKQVNNFRLVYVSMGTVFNNNVFIYDMVIEAIRFYNETKDENLFDLKVIISVGKENLKMYQDKVSSENFQVPENILLMESVPQIDVLERAALFITHCGMNSSCEAIQYGVPIICLPIHADQPLVAHRLSDDLNLGIRFDPLNVTHKDLKSAIDKILRDTSYLQRILDFTKISRKYNGSVESAHLIDQFITNLGSIALCDQLVT